MKDTKISILIPVYNVENYLRECLDSIIAQTFQDFKVICVDDGSDDKSFEILQEYQKKDKRFSVIRQEHKGVGAARNLALSLAKSKYIQFLDSDDFIEPEMLKEMYDTAVKYDTDMVVCTAVRRAPDGTFIEENDIVPVNKNLAIFNTPFNWKDCPDKIFNMFSPESWQVLYKKELLDKNGLRFPDLTSSNGAALGYIARICASKIVILNKAFINYRCLRPGSITSNSNPANGLKQYLELKNYLIKHNLYSILDKSYKKQFTSWLKMKCIYKNIYGSLYTEFMRQLKALDDWQEYECIINHKEIAYSYLNKILEKNRIVFWGASEFLKDFIQRFNLDDDNIVGIIDKNPQLWGKHFGKYKIWQPEDIEKLNPDIVVVSIVHYAEKRILEIKEYLNMNVKKQISIEPILKEM